MQKSKVMTLALAVALALAFATPARAECGDLARSPFGAFVHRQSWGASQFGSASLLRVAVSGEPIVGFWKVTFTAKGNTGISDGTIIDQAFAQWHADGTEIMNSSRPPVTQSFCLGVWKNVGGLQYKLNHFAISFDTSNNLVGPANIHEDVTLSPGGQSFTGSFVIDQFDQAGNTLAHITGVLAGTRVTPDSPASIAF